MGQADIHVVVGFSYGVAAAKMVSCYVKAFYLGDEKSSSTPNALSARSI